MKRLKTKILTFSIPNTVGSNKLMLAAAQKGTKTINSRLIIDFRMIEI
jgi:hypothetical protein